MRLSNHFCLEELTFSEIALRKGWVNEPGPVALSNLKLLCELLLEPIRTAFGVPIHINSGYRSVQINKAVGGALGSAHSIGRAADIKPIGLPLQMAFDQLRTMDRDMDLPLDQCIFECQRWIHVAIAPEGIVPRREFMTATGSPGNWHYERIV